MKFYKGKRVFFCVAFLFVVFLLPCAAFANEASVSIDAPDHAAVGSMITITLHVFHKGDNFIHHVNWAYIKINGKEVKRWEFGPFSLPEAGDFSRQITYTVTAPIQITAEAHCDIHGSAGIKEKTVNVP